MKDTSNRSAAEVGDAYTNALQSSMSNVRVTRNIPPQPLPEQPGRFKRVNPLGNTGLGALAAANGASLSLPDCSGAYIVAASDNTGMSKWGENTHYYSCLWQYKEGWHIDLHVSLNKSSGGASAEGIAKALVNSVAGDSSKNIPAYRDKLISKMQEKGFQTTLLDSYP